MTTKAIQAKIITDSPDKLQYLWLTHCLFNKSLPFIITSVFEMKRGELGEDYKAVYDSITSSQNSFAKLEPLTQTKPPKRLGSGKNKGDWAIKALSINRSGKILFDRNTPPLAFGSEFWRKLCEMTIQLIHGHDELKKIWEEEHKQWLSEKKAWEDENPEFMGVLPLFEGFQNKEGKSQKRRERWHRYLSFLRANPQLAAWKDKGAKLNDLAPEEERDLREKHHKKPGKILEAFFDKNPQLKSLDKKYKKYLEYTRPKAKRRYKDGFKHPPTFTLPSPVNHPAWYTFKNESSYKNLDIKKLTVALKVLTSESGNGRKGEWTTFSFSADPRLKNFQHVGKTGKGKKALSYKYKDTETGETRAAEVRGIKLVFKGSDFDREKKNHIPGRPYLVFTCEIEDKKSRISLKQKSFDKYSTKFLRDKVFLEVSNNELITCAVDLGIRHLGAATVRKEGKLLRTRFLKLTGPTLRRIAAHKKALRRGRSQRGKPVKGEESCIELQQHTTNMGEDRFKKGAHEIVSFARENSTDIIILENLKGFIANAAYEKGINKALAAWNRGNLVKWIKQTAQYYGIKVIEVDAFYSSRLCAKCGSPGARYKIEKEKPVWEWVGKLFVCYECGYRVNADFNASLNLQKIFYDEFPKRDDKLFYNKNMATLRGRVYKHEVAWDALLRKWNVK